MPNTAQQVDFGLPLNIEYRLYQSAEPDEHRLVTCAIEEFGAYHMGVPDTILTSSLIRIGLPANEWHTFMYGVVPIKVVSPFDAPEWLQQLNVPADTVVCFRHNTVDALTSIDEQAPDYTTAVMPSIEAQPTGEQHANNTIINETTLVTPAV